VSRTPARPTSRPTTKGGLATGSLASSSGAADSLGRAGRQDGSERAGGGLNFELELNCPHCGGPFVVTDATVSHACAHCRSLLIIESPEREEIFVEPPQVKDEATILETLIRYRVDGHRSTIVARHSDQEGNPPSDLLINMLVSRFESSLRATARIVEMRRLQVPYRHTSAKVVQSTLGRRGDGAKTARVRAYVAEQTVPAYDPAKFNLRDVGLRLGKSIFKPLLSADVARLGRFLPRTDAPATRRELEKWKAQNLEAGFESVAKHGHVVVNFEATVYRPYFLVRAVLDRGDETVLVDGGFGTIAGYVEEEERARLTAGRDHDPLGTKGPSFRNVFVVPLRCPNCGADPKLPENALISICENCHAGVAPGPKELALVNYEREEGITPARDTLFLPFWRFPLNVAVPGAAPVRSLPEYAALLFPQVKPPGFAPLGDSLYVPAFRLLTTEAGDETFSDLSRAFHAQAWTWTTDRVGLDIRPRFLPASLPEEEARELASSALFAIHTKASAARLNALLFKRFLVDAKLALGRASLAFASFKVNGRVCERADAKVPMLLIEGGPTLETQRVTVQAASAAFVASRNRPSMAEKIRTSRFTRDAE